MGAPPRDGLPWWGPSCRVCVFSVWTASSLFGLQSTLPSPNRQMPAVLCCQPGVFHLRAVSERNFLATCAVPRHHMSNKPAYRQQLLLRGWDFHGSKMRSIKWRQYSAKLLGGKGTSHKQAKSRLFCSSGGGLRRQNWPGGSPTDERIGFSA